MLFSTQALLKFSALVSVGFLATSANAQDEECQTIAEIACGNDAFSTLCTAVTEAGLAEALSGGSWTVFAPTNTAFENLGEDLLATALGDVDLLTDILLFHAVDEPVFSEDLVCTGLVEMANGQDSRTVCHGPSGDGIFQKGGSNSREMMPQVINADIAACNGVVHVVDQVLLPGRLAIPPAPPAECQTIAEIACGTDAFSTLCTAVQQAELAETLSSGLWTVFAPTNDAFAALPDGVLDTVLADNALLTDILLFHVVEGEAFASDLRCAHLVHMVSGRDSRTVCTGGAIYQKGAGNPRDPSAMPEIVDTDIAACNGLIHIVDNVMLP